MNDPLATAKFFIYLNNNSKAKIVLDLLKPYAQTIEQINQIGELYAQIREFNDTLELGYKIYSLCTTLEQKFDARENIIRAYLNLNKPLDALKHIEISEKEKPNYHPIQMDRAFAHFLLDEKDIGEKILRKILEEPHTQDIHNRVNFNLGSYDLRKGNFKEGLKQVLLGGRKLNIWQDFQFSKNQLWQGESAKDKTILVCAEGGIGDEIISVRFMKHLRDRGMNPIWFSNRKDIVEIFERCGFPCITNMEQLPEDWLWTYSMPVPSFLDLTEEELWYGPYIKPLNNSPRLEGNKKIGIKCMGNPKYDQDLHRTIPIDKLIESIPEDYTIYSFHVDEIIDNPRVINLKDRIKSWDDTLDYIEQMDIIVSSCTSLIHAAGAIGKLSSVIVPILTYYTWIKPGKNTKWYGNNLSIFRQTKYNNWDSPLLELKTYLETGL